MSNFEILETNVLPRKTFLQKAQEDLEKCQTEMRQGIHFSKASRQAMVNLLSNAIAVADKKKYDDELYVTYKNIKEMIADWYFEDVLKNIIAETIIEAEGGIIERVHASHTKLFEEKQALIARQSAILEEKERILAREALLIQENARLREREAALIEARDRAKIGFDALLRANELLEKGLKEKTALLEQEKKETARLSSKPKREKAQSGSLKQKNLRAAAWLKSARTFWRNP